MLGHGAQGRERAEASTEAVRRWCWGWRWKAKMTGRKASVSVCRKKPMTVLHLRCYSYSAKVAVLQCHRERGGVRVTVLHCYRYSATGRGVGLGRQLYCATYITNNIG